MTFSVIRGVVPSSRQPSNYSEFSFRYKEKTDKKITVHLLNHIFQINDDEQFFNCRFCEKTNHKFQVKMVFIHVDHNEFIFLHPSCASKKLRKHPNYFNNITHFSQCKLKLARQLRSAEIIKEDCTEQSVLTIVNSIFSIDPQKSLKKIISKTLNFASAQLILFAWGHKGLTFDSALKYLKITYRPTKTNQTLQEIEEYNAKIIETCSKFLISNAELSSPASNLPIAEPVQISPVYTSSFDINNNQEEAHFDHLPYLQNLNSGFFESTIIRYPHFQALEDAYSEQPPVLTQNLASSRSEAYFDHLSIMRTVTP